MREAVKLWLSKGWKLGANWELARFLSSRTGCVESDTSHWQCDWGRKHLSNFSTCASCGVIILWSHFIEVICSFPFFCILVHVFSCKEWGMNLPPSNPELSSRRLGQCLMRLVLVVPWHPSKILVMPCANIQKCQFGTLCFECFLNAEIPFWSKGQRK